MLSEGWVQGSGVQGWIQGLSWGVQRFRVVWFRKNWLPHLLALLLLLFLLTRAHTLARSHACIHTHSLSHTHNKHTEAYEATFTNQLGSPSSSPLIIGLPLDWIGLDWIGLDWIGLDWIGLDWIGLDWMWQSRSE